VRTTLFGDFSDAVEHQHWRQRQLCVAGTEEFAAAASEQIFVLEAVPPRVHAR
jgi:hypothetical protein